VGRANDDPRRKQIADRLKEAIESRGFKVDDFERQQLKRGRGYVAEAIRGSKRLSVELILEVTTKLNVDPQEVLSPKARKGRCVRLPRRFPRRCETHRSCCRRSC
jgi:cyanate lyase